jgi:hypothetical protein
MAMQRADVGTTPGRQLDPTVCDVRLEMRVNLFVVFNLAADLMHSWHWRRHSFAQKTNPCWPLARFQLQTVGP